MGVPTNAQYGRCERRTRTTSGRVTVDVICSNGVSLFGRVIEANGVSQITRRKGHAPSGEKDVYGPTRGTGVT